MRLKLKSMLSILAISMLLIVAGCSEQSNNSSSPATTKIEQAMDKSSDTTTDKKEEKATISTVNIYFPDDNGEKLILSTRQINPKREDKYLATIQTLIDGPTSAKEGIYIMPKGTKILSVKIDNEIATVDFSKEFKSNFSGGSTGEVMLIGSIVNTLTEFDNIKAVRFTVEGRQLESLAGHLDLTTPQKRMENLF